MAMLRRVLCWRLATAVALGAGAAASAAPACPGNTTLEEVLAGKNLSLITAVVTGGDSGLGYALAHGLAAGGASVVIANRNETSARLAADRIQRETGVPVRAMQLNLASLSSVRSFAKAYLESVSPRLDLLVNNAGIAGPSVLTADGFELVFEVDYLGHFLLTELLLPALRASPGARVINVASGAHENACEAAGWQADCFKDWTYLPPPVVLPKNVTIHTRTGTSTAVASSYGIAKFLNIQHAAALARREQRHGILAFSLTPGFALTGMTQRVDPSDPRVKAICSTQVRPDPSLPMNPCPFSARQGAAVIAYLAVGTTLQSGAYYSRTWACETRPVVTQGFTDDMQLELYRRSLEWVGLPAPEAHLIV